jgi:hypothetical protein
MGLGAHLNVPAFIREAAATEFQLGVVAEWTQGLETGVGCEVDWERCDWTDAVWTEWGGSFAEDERVNGIEARIWCACGRVAGVMWRWEGSYAELLRAITSDGDGNA